MCSCALCLIRSWPYVWFGICLSPWKAVLSFKKWFYADNWYYATVAIDNSTAHMLSIYTLALLRIPCKIQNIRHRHKTLDKNINTHKNIRNPTILDNILIICNKSSK